MIFTNFLVGLPLMLLCLVIQVFVAHWCVTYYIGQVGKTTRGVFSGSRPLVIVMVAMMCGNFVQITLWGLLVVQLGEFADYYEAIYHSCVNFTSLGYGDVVMSKNWKLLGPLEAINGVLMLGMTAASLMVVLQHMIRSRLESAIKSTNA